MIEFMTLLCILALAGYVVWRSSAAARKPIAKRPPAPQEAWFRPGPAQFRLMLPAPGYWDMGRDLSQTAIVEVELDSKLASIRIDAFICSGVGEERITILDAPVLPSHRPRFRQLVPFPASATEGVFYACFTLVGQEDKPSRAWMTWSRRAGWACSAHTRAEVESDREPAADEASATQA